MSQIELTYKAREVEESLDVYFYRPFGYVIAKIFHRLRLTPNSITITSMILGIIAGHLFLYRNIKVNLLGIIILIISEAFDSADGQLARMTNIRSSFGRILDGFAGNMIFMSIYIHLCVRIINSGGPIWIFAIAVVAGISHSFQSAMADYYRNCYLYFVISVKKGELQLSEDLIRKYKSLSWRGNFIEKFFMRFYVNYTIEQEFLSRNFLKLYFKSKQVFGEVIPHFFKEQYKSMNKPMIKYYNILTTNTRMIFLFIVILLDVPVFYFAFELIVLNLLLVAVIYRQENINKFLFSLINHIGSKN
ncbi:MAG: CDP-alcohol phosphatidyltransferase family protein [Clostridiales bacterium]